MPDNNQPYILYAMTASLFSAKVRAYLRFNKVNFIERGAGSQEFRQEIVPKVGRWIIPVLKTPTGELLQDGTDILDYLDKNAANNGSIFPEDPSLKAIAHLFELFGSEGLLRPAMHYRWNFDKQNLAFLKVSFRDCLPPAENQAAADASFEFASGRMRKATEFFGASANNLSDVEASYLEFLALLQSHLNTHAFILGGRPTIADYSLFGPLYAHLGRDPYPLALMQQHAPAVFQWLERMNSPHTIDNHLYEASKGELFASNALPQSLIELMHYIKAEYLAEITAHVAHGNNWLNQHPDIPSGSTGVSEKMSQASLGMAEFEWRGKTIGSTVMIYRFYLLQRLTQHFEQQQSATSQQITEQFAATGLDSLLTLKTQRKVIRQNYKEVWE
ncbi:glutathione S-transferase family protein [uncultured Paraglaciecola sp.]|uniref:glutathione S-transferase family protein n=1 Tax=uncultured Paraglaciecola sp. TaxID=1765024 RepID=UPI00261AF13E|nr:glutathione S-transferase [uncultured Paraglaciecola sp.]